MMPLFDLFSRKGRLRRELESLRREIETKRAETAAAETECRRAWGKKWAYIQMRRRGQAAGGDSEPPDTRVDGQAEVFEIRRQRCLAELKVRERELGELLSKERVLAAKLGVEPADPPEVHGEER